MRGKEWALGERMAFSVVGVPGGSVLWDSFPAINVSLSICGHRPSSLAILQFKNVQNSGHRTLRTCTYVDLLQILFSINLTLINSLHFLISWLLRVWLQALQCVGALQTL